MFRLSLLSNFGIYFNFHIFLHILLGIRHLGIKFNDEYKKEIK